MNTQSDLRPLQTMVLADDDEKSSTSTGNTTNPLWMAAQRAAASSQNKSAKALLVSQPVQANRKLRSRVWEYFIQVENKTKVKCNECGWLSLLKQGSTTNMRDHLQNLHPKMVLRVVLLMWICFVVYCNARERSKEKRKEQQRSGSPSRSSCRAKSVSPAKCDRSKAYRRSSSLLLWSQVYMHSCLDWCILYLL